jgi:type II secretory ATPase GspE/PulE/Tfp pilus assembly ATPase PilB-like protein
MLKAAELLRDAGTLTDSVRMVDRILRAGLMMHASDVHFDPMRDFVRVRFRIDGMLEEVLQIPASAAPALTSRLKILSRLDIAERRAPQDGGFSWRMPNAFSVSPLDVRMATLPVRHGERVTLRLLETGGKRMALDDLGMNGYDRGVFERTLLNPQGLLRLTGPTGSGKTTTLYAAINRLLEGSPKNIITVEDPVEYEIPGVAQAEVDSSDKVNFTKALKSLLRHDPDVVMIGDEWIRDSEPARKAGIKYTIHIDINAKENCIEKEPGAFIVNSLEFAKDIIENA